MCFSLLTNTAASMYYESNVMRNSVSCDLSAKRLLKSTVKCYNLTVPLSGVKFQSHPFWWLKISIFFPLRADISHRTNDFSSREMRELQLQFQYKQKPLSITKLERFSSLSCSRWKKRRSGANVFRAKPSLHSAKWASGSCELIGWRSGVRDPRSTQIMNVWLTRSSRCPRCGRGSRTLALCPWWTSWLRLAGSLAGFLRKSLAGGQESRESALRHKDSDLCRRSTAHSPFCLSWFHLHYQTHNLSFTRGAFQHWNLRFGYSQQRLFM